MAERFSIKSCGWEVVVGQNCDGAVARAGLSTGGWLGRDVNIRWISCLCLNVH